MNNKYRDSFLTVEDLEAPLPHGMATVLVARDPQHTEERLCRITEDGYVRDFNGAYIRDNWTAEPRGEGDEE